MSAVTADPVTPVAQNTRTPLRRRRFNPGKAALSLLGVVLAAIWLFPVYWMMNSAVTPDALLGSDTPQFLPLNFTLTNLSSVLTDSGFLNALGMSLMVTGLTITLVLAYAFLAALAISRWRFRGRTSFILAVLFIQMLPAEGLFIAQYQMMSSLGLLNQVIGISALYVAMLVPFTVWMLRGFVAGVPIELEEAAMVDGLSRPRAFMRITFPLLAPGLIASGVYAFLQAWNEFTTALVILPAESAQTLPIWLRSFLSASANRGINWAEVMAASTLIAVPVIIFFLFVQGRMTSGLVSGAVKG